MRVFITGATGFIGSYVAYELLRSGHELVVVARDPNKLSALTAQPRVQRVTALLSQRARLREALQGCDACVHVALGWGDTPEQMLLNDTLPSVALVEDCARLGVSQFLYTSSTAALGPFLPTMDEANPLRPTDYYGATKAATEAYVLATAAQSGVRCNVIRPGYTFGNPVVEGATTQPDRRFHAIAQAVREGRDLQVKRGDGTQFVWAGDLARLYRAVLESHRNREVYFGLGANFVSWEAVAELAQSLSAGSASRIVAEGPEPHAPPCLFDLSKIERHFGLVFDALPQIRTHLTYLLKLAEEPSRP